MQSISTAGFELVTLKTGVKSLRRLDNLETFHPGIGPAAEAKILHVDQQRLAERCAQPGKFVIWDVGFGAAANAVAAIESLQGCIADVEIHSFDQSLDPILFALENAEDLDYLLPHRASLNQLIFSGKVVLSPNVQAYLHLGDFREQLERTDLPAPNAIFYDPYSPTENMDMWTLDHFTRLRKRLDDSVPCLITNYSRSTVVRVTWLMAGFFVGIGSSIGQKEETSLASNSLELLQSPLETIWLKRVKISHNAAPLRDLNYAISPMSAQDFETLQQHPQFLSKIAFDRTLTP